MTSMRHTTSTITSSSIISNMASIISKRTHSLAPSKRRALEQKDLQHLQQFLFLWIQRWPITVMRMLHPLRRQPRLLQRLLPLRLKQPVLPRHLLLLQNPQTLSRPHEHCLLINAFSLHLLSVL